jgi:hypothetical protein
VLHLTEPATGGKYSAGQQSFIFKTLLRSRMGWQVQKEIQNEHKHGARLICPAPYAF